MESYVDLETDDNIARGMTPQDARAAARRTLGNATLAREEVYQMNTLGFLDTTSRDLRFGLRVLFRQPAFALVAVLSLALGVGANTAIFQLIDTVRLRTLPVDRPEELTRVSINSGDGGRTGRFTSRYAHLTSAIYERIRDRQQSLTSLAAWGPVTFDLAASGESRPAQGLWISGNFFSTLGVAPLAGTLVGPDHDTPACDRPSATISHAFWQREFSGAADAVGRTIRLDGQAFVVGGVTPPSFFGVEVGRQFDVALPLCAERQINGTPRHALNSNDWWWLASIGRLKPGVGLEQAAAELKALSAPIFSETTPAGYTPTDAESYRKFVLEPLPIDTGFSTLRGQYNTPLMLLLGLAGLVLLIACGNLANLMLARASAREQEMAVRLAIGASRWRLIRQLMSESLIIAVAGAALGVWIARTLSGLLVSFLSTDSSPLMLDLATNWRVLGFTTALAVLTCLLFGLAPALRATRTAPIAAMRGSGRGITDGRGRFTLRRALVVTQLALSLVLLVGALLFTRTFWNLANADVGFTTSDVVAMNFDLRRTQVPADALPGYHQMLLDRVRAIPGIAGASAVSIVPMSGSGWNQSLVVDGVLQKGFPWVNQVGGNFFELLDIQVKSGRTFDQRDVLGAPRTVLVNETFVSRYLPDREPIGRTFHFEGRPGDPVIHLHVIGVVADTKYSNVRQGMEPIAFMAYDQDPDPGPSFTAVVRAAQPGVSLSQAAVQTASQVSGDMLVTTTPLQQPITFGLARERLMATLSGFFGILAVLLAALGLYGVMSYMVAQRRQEIGIRMALGAGRGRVLSLVLREALILVVIGIAAGAGLAVLAGRSAETLLFGLTANDPLTIVASVAGLAIVAAIASVIPAWRAARVEPTTALRA
jgi:putative ABC transport system permease protein